MAEHFVQLNAEKTDVIILGKKKERIKITTHLNAEGLKPKDTIKNLGVVIDSNLSFNCFN